MNRTRRHPHPLTPRRLLPLFSALLSAHLLAACASSAPSWQDMAAKAAEPPPPSGELMVKPAPPLHCVPDRPATLRQGEDAIACLGGEIVKRDQQIDGLQDYARDVSNPKPKT